MQKVKWVCIATDLKRSQTVLSLHCPQDYGSTALLLDYFAPSNYYFHITVRSEQETL